MVMKVSTVTAAVLIAAGPLGCGFQVAASRPEEVSAPVFEAAVRHITETAGWPVRVDARTMDSIPTRFDFDRDVLIAPTPTLMTSLPGKEQGRRQVLARLGIPEERIDEYTACTPHMGGIPVSRPGATDESRAAADSARRACATRATHGAAILGLPRRSDGASWKIRVYFLTPVSRQVFDLLLAPAGEQWSVAGREELFSVSS